MERTVLFSNEGESFYVTPFGRNVSKSNLRVAAVCLPEKARHFAGRHLWMNGRQSPPEEVCPRSKVFLICNLWLGNRDKSVNNPYLAWLILETVVIAFQFGPFSRA